MNPIPKKLRDELKNDPYYKKCVRRWEGDCRGRITWEHCWIVAGRQINKRWAIIPLCEYHHSVNQFQGGNGLNKEINRWVSINRATREDLEEFPKVDWGQKKKYLNQKYGISS